MWACWVVRLMILACMDLFVHDLVSLMDFVYSEATVCILLVFLFLLIQGARCWLDRCLCRFPQHVLSHGGSRRDCFSIFPFSDRLYVLLCVRNSILAYACGCAVLLDVHDCMSVFPHRHMLGRSAIEVRYYFQFLGKGLQAHVVALSLIMQSRTASLGRGIFFHMVLRAYNFMSRCEAIATTMYAFFKHVCHKLVPRFFPDCRIRYRSCCVARFAGRRRLKGIRRYRQVSRSGACIRGHTYFMASLFQQLTLLLESLCAFARVPLAVYGHKPFKEPLRWLVCRLSSLTGLADAVF